MLTVADLERIHAEYLRHREEHLFLLADHSGVPDLAKTLRANAVTWVNLFGDDLRPSLTAASPLLFEIKFSGGQPEKRQLLKWLGNDNHSSSLLLISSPLSMRDLARGLAKRCDGTLSEGEAIVIRFFDTRVFPSLLSVMHDDERSAWLGIASGWWYRGRDGATVHVVSEMQSKDTHQAPMRISDAQMAQLLHASEPDEIAYLLEINLPDPFLTVDPAERYCLLREKLQNGRAIGLTQLSDLALYCGLAFLYNPGFDLEPGWKSALARVRANELSLQEAIESMEQSIAIS